MLLRESPNKGTATFDSVVEQAERTLQTDSSEYRSQFVDLVKKARALMSTQVETSSR